MKVDLPIISSRDNFLEIFSLGNGRFITSIIFNFEQDFSETHRILNRNGMVLGKIFLPDNFRIISNSGLPENISNDCEVVSLLTINSPELISFSQIDYNSNIHDFFTIIDEETQDFIFILASKDSYCEANK